MKQDTLAIANMRRRPASSSFVEEKVTRGVDTQGLHGSQETKRRASASQPRTRPSKSKQKRQRGDSFGGGSAAAWWL